MILIFELIIANDGPNATSTCPITTHSIHDANDADLPAQQALLSNKQRGRWRLLASLLIFHFSSLTTAHVGAHQVQRWRAHPMSTKCSYKPPWPPPIPWASLLAYQVPKHSIESYQDYSYCKHDAKLLTEATPSSSEKFSQDLNLEHLKEPRIARPIKASQPLIAKPARAHPSLVQKNLKAQLVCTNQKAQAHSLAEYLV